MAKQIGIYGWSLGENSFGCTKTYLEFISQFGEPRILNPYQKFEKVDMLLLPGGLDVNPYSYGSRPGFYTSNTDVFKQFVYDACLPAYIEAKIPVFGICLGLQQLASHFDSVLTQNLLYHKTSKDRYQKAHEVEISPDAITLGIYAKAEKKNFEVNSHHHQAVLLKDLGVGLIPLAIADNEVGATLDDDIVEAFVHSTLPVAACQWHPEEWVNDNDFAVNLVKLLLDGGLNRG